MWVTAVLLSMIAKDVQSQKCRVLAVGGGTDLGAYEAGAIIGLIQGFPAGEAQWDIVTGVGVGSVNGLILSMYAKGQESSAATKLNSFWTSFTYDMFYQDWTGGYVTGLLLKSGLYDTSPMKKTLTGLQTGAFARVLVAGTTDLISAQYNYFESDVQSSSSMATGVYASASDYGIFPIVYSGIKQLVTGSILYSADIISGVNYCKKKGFTISNMSVDVVLGAGKTMTPVNASNYKTLQVLMRYFAISSYNGVMKAITNAQHDFAGLNIRTIVYPSQDLPSASQPYEYTPEQLQQQIALGIADGKKLAVTLEDI